MQKLESVHPLMEKIAKQEYSLNIVADINFVNVKITFSLFVGPELGHIVLVCPWE